MFDHDAEDKDLESQVSKGRPDSSGETAGSLGELETRLPQTSEQTTESPEQSESKAPISQEDDTLPETLLANTSASPGTYIKAAGDSALPEKLENPPKQEI